MSRKHVKRYLMLLMAVGVIAVSLSGGGTFASFNAAVSNNANTFETGTLFLHETKGATTCTSESASSNANFHFLNAAHTGDTCAQLFSGVGNQVVGLDMKNAGSLDGDGLQFALGDGTNQPTAGCVSTQTYQSPTDPSPDTLATTITNGATGVTTITVNSGIDVSFYSGESLQLDDGSGHTQFVTTSQIEQTGATTIHVNSFTAAHTYTSGTATLSYSFAPVSPTICTDLKLSIVEVASTSDFVNAYIDPTTGDLLVSNDSAATCVYGGSTTNVGPDYGCDGTGTAVGSIPQYNSYANLNLNSDNVTDPNTLTGLDAGTHRYIILGFYIDPSAGNSSQDSTATFDLVWNMNQATS